ncbi:MAG: hypothetical protein KDD55_04095 [Bdellovibrionales bacterium]|nr:hypothetical protein [Bdellovibrionales bacterium]
MSQQFEKDSKSDHKSASLVGLSLAVLSGAGVFAAMRRGNASDASLSGNHTSAEIRFEETTLTPPSAPEGGSQEALLASFEQDAPERAPGALSELAFPPRAPEERVKEVQRISPASSQAQVDPSKLRDALTRYDFKEQLTDKFIEDFAYLLSVHPHLGFIAEEVGSNYGLKEGMKSLIQLGQDYFVSPLGRGQIEQMLPGLIDTAKKMSDSNRYTKAEIQAQFLIGIVDRAKVINKELVMPSEPEQ